MFWLLATRAFAPQEVGLAAAAASAMMLCIQFALLGTDWAAIGLYPQHRASPAVLFRVALTVVGGGGLAAGSLFLLLASQGLHELRVVATTPLFAAPFVAACALGATLMMADSLSVAMWRPRHILGRSLAVGACTLGALAALVIFSSNRSAERLFSCWLVGYAGASVLNALYLHRAVSFWREKAISARISVQRLLRAGLPNYALSLAEQAPGLVMPVVVTELLSAETNAYWYTIWLGAASIYVVPGAAAAALFAEISDARVRLGRAVRRTLAVALVLGGVGAAVLAALAHRVLTVFGDAYAAAAATPLRILLIGVIPLAFFYAYLAVCRATRRFWEAVPIGLGGGMLALTVGAVAGTRHGLIGVAWAWLGAQLVMGAWATWRLRAITRAVPEPARESVDRSTTVDLKAIMRRET